MSFNGRVAVRDATFDVAKNRVTSLIGPSGSGKTTLLRALNRLHDLTARGQGNARSCLKAPTSIAVT